MSRNGSEDGSDEASNDDRSQFSRRDWMKIGATGIGTSMLGLTNGATPTAAATSSDTDGSGNYYDLTNEVPDEAWDLWQSKPDMLEDQEFRDGRSFDVFDASEYDARNGDLSERIIEASQNGAIVDLGSGTYEMESAVRSGDIGDIVGIVGDGARIHYVGTDLEVLFQISPDYLVMEDVTFDITEDAGNNSTDVSIIRSYGIGNEAWCEDVTLEGSRHRQQDLNGDGTLTTVGARSTFLIQMAAGATGFMHRCKFPDGGTDMTGHPDGDTHLHAYGPNADPSHEGLNVWKDCVAKNFEANAFYVLSRTEPGKNILWNCTARDNARGNMRISHHDRIIGGTTEVSGRTSGQLGTPFASGYGGDMEVVGLEMIADGDHWGADLLQLRNNAQDIHFRKCVIHVKGGSGRPIRVDSSEHVNATFEDMYIYDEGTNDHTFYIGKEFLKWHNPGTALLENDVRVESDNGAEFFIDRITPEGEWPELHHNGNTYRDTVVSASELGLESPLDGNGDLPEFYFGYEDGTGGADGGDSIIDDFEREELTEYSFDDEASLSDAAARNGMHGLDLDGNSNTSGTVRSDSGLGTYPGPDDIWEFWWNPQTANQNFNVNFALQSGDLTEGFRVNVNLDDSNQLISFQERGSSGDTYIGQTDLEIETGTWYRTIVDGSRSDGWSIHVDTGAGSSVVGEFTTDATQYTHYERSGIAYWISGADRVYLDDIAVRNENPLRDEEPPGTVVDDFESGDLNDYSVTGIDGAAASDDARFRGSYGLELNGATGGSGTVRSDTGLDAYPGQNDRWEFWWNPQTESEFFRVTFAIQSDDRSEAFNLVTSLERSNQFVQLEERGPNGDEYLGHADLDLSTDTWYRTVVDGTDSDTWTISVDTGEDTTTIGEFTSDPTRYTWYDRSGIAYWISGSDHVYLDDVTIRERGADADGVPGTVVDDFESGELEDYAVSDMTEAATSDAASFRGDYGLELDGSSGTSGNVRSDTGLNAYPGQNDNWEFWWNTRTESEHVSVYFAIQSDDLSETFRLSVGLDSSDQFVELEERGATGDNYLGHADLDLSTDTWYRTVIDGTDGDRWTVSVDTGEGTPTVGEFTSDPTQYTWYDRSGIAYWISGSDRVFFDDVTIRTMGEPSDEATDLVVDDFDDADLEEWSIPSQSGTVETVTDSYDGSAALRCYDDDHTRAFANDEGSPSLEYVPQPGDKWEFYIKIDNAHLARFYFGRQGPEDDAGQYEIQLNRNDGTDGFRIKIDDGNSSTTVGTGAYGDIYETGTWYRVRHWWDRSEKESSHVCELYDVSAESVVATVSGNDETWESGGIGVWANGNTGITVDQIRILDRDP
ncbi:hypothetical protein HYG81_17120 [Natrinema zhouii]|uniref:Uncharacterized protein n=1 Tax=Natrinema zhouii TaxID=1710539 RepID=A0A7D6CNB9_9EURY|nr:hypothetical protein [Natrinema zhouii]QLK25777.1 hypothetical protein HYG81_17120 [Natrinema zhouii]